ncbi:hypothetical protein MMC13_001629, partial [Lambiella insularis]|nr:hypothetical protein [Lambiella insularis]
MATLCVDTCDVSLNNGAAGRGRLIDSQESARQFYANKLHPMDNGAVLLCLA